MTIGAFHILIAKSISILLSQNDTHFGKIHLTYFILLCSSMDFPQFSHPLESSHVIIYLEKL